MDDRSPIQRLIGLARHTYHKGYGLVEQAQEQYNLLKVYQTIQPCGHEGRFIVSSKEGTSSCLMCEFVAQKQG